MIKFSVEVMELKIFEELQRISKSLMLPVAVLPAAAIMFRFGSADLFNVEVIEKAGYGVTDNFCNINRVWAGKR